MKSSLPVTLMVGVRPTLDCYSIRFIATRRAMSDHIKQRQPLPSRLLWPGTMLLAVTLTLIIVAMVETLWLEQVDLLSLLAALIVTILIAGLLSFLMVRCAKSYQSLHEQQTVLNHAERLAHLGAWSYELSSDEFRPSKEWRNIVGITSSVLTLRQVTSLVHPEDLTMVSQSIEQLIRQGMKYDMCHRIISPMSGKILHLHVYAEPVLSAGGKVVRILGASQDISERVATEAALKLNEARYRLIVESAQEGILLLDGDGRCTLSNPKMTAMLGYQAEELRGRQLGDFMDSEWRITAEQAQSSCFIEGPVRRNLKLRCKDGSELWTQIGFSPIDQDPAYAGDMLVMVTDITEKMRLEQLLQNHVRKLEEIDHRKDEFLAQLGHELRNPLTPLSLTAYGLKNGAYHGKELNQCYESIERQTRHLSRLVDDLLDVSRVGSGVIRLQKKPLSLHPLLEQAVQISLPHIQGNQHQLELRLIETPLVIEGDETRLMQVVSNLLNNAAKFTPTGGQIILSLYREGDEAVILVKDNGVGIQSDQLHRVFELFAQVNQPATQGNDGLGIGLYLAHELVGLHGGRLEVNSDGENKGSEFVIRLPIAATPAADSTLPRSSDLSKPPSQNSVMETSIP